MSDERGSLPKPWQQVIDTLRQLGWASEGGWFYELADKLDSTEPKDWWSCPLCEETVCDDGCPLSQFREGVVYGARGRS